MLLLQRQILIKIKKNFKNIKITLTYHEKLKELIMIIKELIKY